MPIIATGLAEFGRMDFQTHLKYASTLARLSRGMSVTGPILPSIGRAQVDRVKDKLKLIELTKRSLDDESRIVELDEEYSSASVLWLPIKSYYLIYHLLSIIDFILTGQVGSLRMHHGELISCLTDRLVSSQLQFSVPLLNSVFDKSILNFKSKSGEHLSSSVSDTLIYNLIMKKTATYKREDYKLNAKLNLKTLKGRDKMKNYLANKLRVSIFDYFYEMRLKLNYKGLDFVSGISAGASRRYFRAYYEAANNFYICFDNLKTRLITSLP